MKKKNLKSYRKSSICLHSVFIYHPPFLSIFSFFEGLEELRRYALGAGILGLVIITLSMSHIVRSE